MKTAIVWFRRDLRTADNPALCKALERCERVIPLYIHSPDEEAPWQPGEASNWWLHHSLQSLDRDLQRLGSKLIVRQGSSKQILESLAHQSGAEEIHWNRLYEPVVIARDSAIKSHLRSAGFHCQSHNAALLFEPWEILTKTATPYKVFTAFWKACQAKRHIPQPCPAPTALPPVDLSLNEAGIDNLDLLPKIPWHGKLSAYWKPGEASAQNTLMLFIREGIHSYESDRDIPEKPGTSHLSPHLHFGEIGPRQIQWALFHNMHDDWMKQEPNLFRFLAEIGWREFAHHLLYHFPHTTEQPLNRRFQWMTWDNSDQAMLNLESWKQGKTGIPIVDAGMRELWETGMMHNRVRMIVASLLCKNLAIHWHQGARWFWNTLLDADLASNTLGWQWTAGSGADAAPYFRIFNPVRQGERFDPQGIYIRRWIPELAHLANRHIHTPWLSDMAADYPDPIVDLGVSRKQALERWDILRAIPPAAITPEA